MSKYNIWGKEFKLNVLFECQSDKEPTKIQNQALEKFENELNKNNGSKGTNTIQYYLDSQKEIMSFISNLDGIDDIDTNCSILDYLTPTEIIVLNEKDRMVEIICDFKFDMEHSISLRFKNEKFDGFYQIEV